MTSFSYDGAEGRGVEPPGVFPASRFSRPVGAPAPYLPTIFLPVRPERTPRHPRGFTGTCPTDCDFAWSNRKIRVWSARFERASSWIRPRCSTKLSYDQSDGG